MSPTSLIQNMIKNFKSSSGPCGRRLRRRVWDTNMFQVRSTYCAKLSHTVPRHLQRYEIKKILKVLNK